MGFAAFALQYSISTQSNPLRQHTLVLLWCWAVKIVPFWSMNNVFCMFLNNSQIFKDLEMISFSLCIIYGFVGQETFDWFGCSGLLSQFDHLSGSRTMMTVIGMQANCSQIILHWPLSSRRFYRSNRSPSKWWRVMSCVRYWCWCSLCRERRLLFSARWTTLTTPDAFPQESTLNVKVGALTPSDSHVSVSMYIQMYKSVYIHK